MSNRSLRVTPNAGPPGITVHLEGTGLPASVELVVGFGAPRGNHELLESVRSTSQGEFVTSLAIPGWATADLAHYFFLNLPDQPPLVTSEAFHVARRDGSLRVDGVIGETSGSEVVELQGYFRDPYCIQGGGAEFAALPPGTGVSVTGTVGDASACPRGIPVRLTSYQLR